MATKKKAAKKAAPQKKAPKKAAPKKAVKQAAPKKAAAKPAAKAKAQPAVAATVKTKKSDISRYAHPFVTNTPVAQRKATPVGKRMTDYIAGQILPISAVKGDSSMTLEDVIGTDGANEIAAEKELTFHTVGDTGEPHGTSQEDVALAMAADYTNVAVSGQQPAFFLHLGDVNYYDNSDSGYHEQFYAPYKNYPGKIIAIPGNHDGELFKYDGTSTKQTSPCQEFIANFCQDKPGVPTAAGTIYREMVAQPGVYWYLDCPLIDIIGLYSNMAESPGYIVGPNNDQTQKTWLQKTLAKIASGRSATRKALLIVVHHPPFSTSGHNSSPGMLQDIDDCCAANHIMPDAVLSAHAHNYQRYTRYITFEGKPMQIPFPVVGTGGRAVQKVLPATGAKTQDTYLNSYHTYDKAVSDYGYMTVTVTPTQLKLVFTTVENKTQVKKVFDTMVVNLATNKVTAS